MSDCWKEMAQFDNKIVYLLVFVIVFMFIGAGVASTQRQNCRLELAKANRSADDIIKICP